MPGKNNNAFTFKRIALALLAGAMVTAAAHAVESPETGTVIGVIPVMLSPVIDHSSDVGSLGLVDAGDTLSFSGTFGDADSDIEDGTTYRWSNDGGTTTIGTAKDYIVTAADAGKTLHVYVIPKTDSAITDPFEGAEVSASISATAVTVTSVSIAGFPNGTNPQVSSPLTAAAVCNTASCGSLKYQWKVEDTPGGSYVNVGTDSNTYTPVRGDQLKKIKVDVTVN